MSANFTPDQKGYKTYQSFGTFRLFVLENFPFIAEDFDALTYYQMLCKVVGYLKDVITNNESLQYNQTELLDAFNELQSYVNTYFDNLDVQEEINNKLDEMVLDGTFDKIINQNILGNTIKKNDTKFGMKLNAHRIFRKRFNSGVNFDNPENKDFYSHSNGFCMIDNNTCALSTISINNYNNNNAHLMIIDLNNGNVLKEIINDFGHANSLSYNKKENLLYIAGCDRYVNNSSDLIGSTKFYVLDYNNLSIKKTIDLPNFISGVSYDNDTNRLFVSNRNGIEVHELDVNDFNIINTISLEQNNYIFYGFGQNITISDDKIYMNKSKPEIILVYDLNGKFLNVYNFPEYLDNSFYTGELEAIDMYNNKLYFMSDMKYSSNSYMRCSQIGYTSLIDNIEQNSNAITYTSNSSITIYVDNNTNYVNPNGLENNKFYDLDEAIDFLSSPLANNLQAIITLANNSKPYSFCMLSNRNINQINGNGAKINGLRIVNSSLNLLNLTIASDNTFNTHALYFSNSTISVRNCIFQNSLSDIDILFDYNSTLNLADNNSFQNSIVVSNTSVLHSGVNKLNNVRIYNPNNNIDKFYLLLNGNLKDIGSYSENDKLTSAYLKNFNYINFTIQTSTSSRVLKYSLHNKTNPIFALRVFNITDATDTNVITLSEMNVRLNTSNHRIIVENNKTVNIDGFRTVDNEIVLTECFLSSY